MSDETVIEDFVSPTEEKQEEGDSLTPEGQEEVDSSTTEEEGGLESKGEGVSDTKGETEQDRNWKNVRVELDALKKENAWYKQQIEKNKPSGTEDKTEVKSEEDMLEEVANASTTVEFARKNLNLHRNMWKKDFNDAAQGYIRDISQQVNIIIDERMAREKYPDFQEVWEIIKPELESSPALWKYVQSLPNPAMTIYDMGIRKKAGLPDFAKKQKEAGKREILDKLSEEKGHKTVKGGKTPTAAKQLSDMSWEQVKKLPPEVQKRYLMGMKE